MRASKLHGPTSSLKATDALPKRIHQDPPLYEKSLLMDPEMATYSYEFEHPPRLLQIFALVWDPILWAGFGARAAYKMRPVSAQMGF